MTRHVLVPYDGSDQSEDALEYALTALSAERIVLLHVIEPHALTTDGAVYTPDSYDQQRETAETMLETAVENHGNPDHVETEIAVGRPVHCILSYTEDNHVDHIVMGSHGRDGAARLLLGSVAETVVRRAPVPVTVVRSAQESVEAPGRVLVPFDGSSAARDALEHTFDRFETAEVTALYVLYPVTQALTGTTGYGAVSDELDTWQQERQDHAEDVLDIARSDADKHDRELETAVTEGKPAETIVDHVEDNDYDHVVIGSTGRDGITRLLLGSVAETVVRRSPVSVTVVK